jgi:hypothetical protein
LFTEDTTTSGVYLNIFGKLYFHTEQRWTASFSSRMMQRHVLWTSYTTPVSWLKYWKRRADFMATEKSRWIDHQWTSGLCQGYHLQWESKQFCILAMKYYSSNCYVACYVCSCLNWTGMSFYVMVCTLRCTKWCPNLDIFVKSFYVNGVSKCE